MASSNNQHQQNTGLLRYPSAPTNFLDNNSCEGFDPEELISRFNASNGNNRESYSKFSLPPSQQLPPQYPRHGLNNKASSNAVESSYGMVGTGMQVGGVSSNLVRQSSSPAGLFSPICVQNGYAAMNAMGNYDGFSGTSSDMTPSSKGLQSQMSFSSGLPSSLGMLSRISELPNEGIEASSSDGKYGNGLVDSRYNSTGFPYLSWGDTSLFSENITAMKTEPDVGGKLFSNDDHGNGIPMLSHHLSLPKNPPELVPMDKILQFQDSVPCKLRAKRGCATHPRSIAERMRRIRISDRMRKLQELIPSMDKQTNTADMLDLAVEYIKDLQKQFKTLSDRQKNCKCFNRQHQVQDYTG